MDVVARQGVVSGKEELKKLGVGSGEGPKSADAASTPSRTDPSVHLPSLPHPLLKSEHRPRSSERTAGTPRWQVVPYSKLASQCQGWCCLPAAPGCTRALCRTLIEVAKQPCLTNRHLFSSSKLPKGNSSPPLLIRRQRYCTSEQADAGAYASDDRGSRSGQLFRPKDLDAERFS